ncbi:hypothetical protein SPFM15_00046 [Salmonella phage SPFM15]|nr:hypothetical protein SPFM5_00041 [Salmonella phage SPFM5]VFR13670.1 hypothetical protein SPFM15_00046 [Salmonella phage SPFM15]
MLFNRNPRVDVKFDGKEDIMNEKLQELLKAHFEPWMNDLQTEHNGEVAMPQLLLRMVYKTNESVHDIIVNCLLATSLLKASLPLSDDDLAKQTYQAVFNGHRKLVKTPETTSTLGDKLMRQYQLLACRCGLEFDRVVSVVLREPEPDPKSYSALLRTTTGTKEGQLQQLMLIAVETGPHSNLGDIVVPLSDAVSLRLKVAAGIGESIWTFAALLHLLVKYYVTLGRISAGVDELDKAVEEWFRKTDIYQQKATERQQSATRIRRRKPVFSIIQQVQV